MVGLDEIEFHFGPAVKRIVEGETKFSKLPTRETQALAVDMASGSGGGGAHGAGGGDSAAATAAAAVDEKAQDLQFLFLAMTEEVRARVGAQGAAGERESA